MTAPIQNLPPEILTDIIQFVPLEDRQTKVTSVCMLFNQIISHQVFDHEREEYRLRKAFPEKLIKAVGGIKALQGLTQVDFDPNDIFKQEINEPVRGKIHPFLFFKIHTESSLEQCFNSILVFKEEPTKQWKVKSISNQNEATELTTSDTTYIKHLFKDRVSYQRNFLEKNNTLPGDRMDIKLCRKKT